ARFWKSDAVPTFEMWLREVGEILYLEKLRFKNAGRGRVLDKALAPVMRHLRGLGEDEGVG
ncbi:hypothetical protein NQZ68_030585, partial [Dissostichus eleginoides]